MLKQTENFGIYLGEEMIGKKEKIFQYVKLSLEYRLISWELSIQLPHSKLIANLISSPNSACGEVVSQIVEMFSLQSEVDYTLFLPPDISFDDTKLLSSILLLVDIPAVIIFSLFQINLSIKLMKNSFLKNRIENYWS